MPKNDASKPRRPLPKDISPAVAQAVLEDAMLEAAADLAALSATLAVSAPPHTDPALSTALPVPETPEEEELMDLLGVPHLGPVRRQLLADAGIETLADLEALSPDALADIKGIGLGNARRIKDWLDTRPADPAPAPATVDTPSDKPLAVANQDVQDLFGRIEQATHLLKSSLSPEGGVKRLSRQLAKLDTVSSELAEGPDTLTAKQLQKAVKILDKVAALLEDAAGTKRLSLKKQDVLIDTLKEHRKTLEKTVGD